MTAERQTLRPGYAISRVIKGGWQLAGGHGAFDRRQAISDMVRFVDAGITTFDCADIYTGVEEMIGDFVATLRSERGSEASGQVQIHTKLVPDFQRLDDFTARDAETIIDRSLKRLRVERLDLVQFYWWDLARGQPFDVLASLKDIQAKGKIRHLATTNWDTDVMNRFLDAGLDLISAQVQYSLLDARPGGRFAAWCEARQISILCYGTIAGGFLTETWLGKPDPGHVFENRSLVKYRLIIDEFGGWDLFQTLLKALDGIARKHGRTIAAVASRLVLERPNVAAVIVGARTADHLGETLPIFDLRLDADDRQEIDSILSEASGPRGPIYGLERDRTGPHGRIMKYNLNSDAA